VAPSSVRKAVVNSVGHTLADSVWKSIFSCTAWPLLDARKGNKVSKKQQPAKRQGMKVSASKPKRRRQKGMC
jgi:hypothetical protein